MRFPRGVLPFIGAVSALFTLVQGVCCLLPTRRLRSLYLFANHLPFSGRSQASEAIRQVTPIENAVIRTQTHQIDYLSHFDLTFELQRDGQRIKLELEPNHDILADDAYVQYIGADGLWEG
jgi:hypothetical protein